MKKTILCLLAAITLTAASVWAEPDNGRVLPSFHLMGIENVFLEGTGGVSFPLTFFTQNSIPMTSFGGEFSFGAGYNWDGWLIGAEAGRDMWGQGVGAAALMNNFNNNLLLFRLQRVLSKNTLHFLPEWLEFVPGLGIGVNFITTDYYPSQRAKNEGRESHVTLFQEHADTMFYRLSLEASFYLGTDYFIPFVGGDYSAFYDTSIGGGFAGFATAYVGIRTYPFGIINDVKTRSARRAEQAQKAHDDMIASWGEAVCAITADPDTDFTPDGDGLNDVCTLAPSVQYLEDDPESWKIEMLDPQQNTFRTWTGTGKLPDSLPWDGLSDSGETVFSRDTYTAKLSVTPDEKDRARTGQSLLEASAPVNTGILMQVVKPNEEWKIVVNTIFFDPDRPTFDLISEEQRQSNKNTLDSVAEQIRAHGDSVKVTVEGYANNVSNTEKENIEELIPLSQARAEAIMKQLVDRGLDAGNLSAKGYGGANPLAAWEDHANWWKNRRVEFLLRK